MINPLRRLLVLGGLVLPFQALARNKGSKKTALTGGADSQFPDVSYSSVSASTVMDIYMPVGATTPPLVMWVHGGAFWGGDKRDSDSLNRALPGAREPARPGRGSNTPMQPLYMKPRPFVTTPEGMPSEWVIETQFPSRSTIETCVVSLLGSPALKRGTSTFRPDLMSRASSAP